MSGKRLARVAPALAALVLLLLQSPVAAATLPSLFRGVMVTNGEMGVRVVSIDEESQAAQADLRPDDVIVQVDSRPVKTIDEFAEVSQDLRRRAAKATVTVLRNGQPQDLLLHLYSYPILKEWGLKFIPDYDLHFIDPSAALVYWLRMARGFEGAGQMDQALNATLNALHYRPDNLDLAVHATELISRIARAQADQGRMPEAVAAMQEATILMQRLFDKPLDTVHLETIKRELVDTVKSLKRRKP